ncbi:uncharacterized protein LOC131614134 [Vicia villosa]|uniref:uncharacterized protein LOC131614134 n=1 Tax=Vicia villosa TaxID=3911 RepID=UPI00273B863D|nr:uncharacterized protein LOC131614134 [Vicia villosa]
MLLLPTDKQGSIVIFISISVCNLLVKRCKSEIVEFTVNSLFNRRHRSIAATVNSVQPPPPSTLCSIAATVNSVQPPPPSTLCSIAATVNSVQPPPPSTLCSIAATQLDSFFLRNAVELGPFGPLAVTLMKMPRLSFCRVDELAFAVNKHDLGNYRPLITLYKDWGQSNFGKKLATINVYSYYMIRNTLFSADS